MFQMMKTVDTVWSNCLKFIRQQVNEQSFRTWFEPIKAVNLEGSILTIQVPSQFFYEWLEDRYVHLLRQALVQELGEQARLEYQIVIDRNMTGNTPYTINMPTQNTNGGLGLNAPPKAAKNTEATTIKNPFVIPGIKEQSIDSQLNPTYTFDTYIEGESNQLARSAGIAIAKNPGKTAFNPLVLYGGAGLGKTHLAQAIGNYVKNTFEDKTVLYVAADRFTSQFIDAVKSGSINDFVNFYQMIDVLIVDDIQFFANKDRTQDIFFHTFNHLHQSGRQIILTSDRAPRELEGMEERLLSRFKWGLTADIKLPDYETRIAILEKKLHANGVDLPREVIEYIAQNVQTNIREMEGVVNSVMAQALLTRKDVDLDLTKTILHAIIETKAQNTGVSVKSIQNMVADYFNFAVEQLESSSRKREIVQARQIAMYLIKKYMDLPLKTIGASFGNRDHSTVIHACQAIADLSQTDENFRRHLNNLEKQIIINLKK